MSKQTKKPMVSFVILNWNGLNDTKKCIESVRSINYPNKEIIVVDNGSEDGSKPYLASLKDIIYLDFPENTGFTGGHIAGRDKAKGDYIALINNDLVLDKEWANHCLRVFEKHPKAAVVGGKAFKWNDENPMLDTTNEFYSYQEVDPETGYNRTLLTGEDETRVDSISGAALMVKQSALEGVGYLDNNFFAYYEESDLIARLLRAGKEAYYCPEAHTWHKIAASTGDDSEFYLYMMHRNRYFYAYKNLDEKYLNRFIKNYRWQVFNARYRLLRNSSDIDALCRIKAYKWVRDNKQLLQQSREEVQSLGGSYTDHLKSQLPKDVTIIIPCYNYGNYVQEAVDSALSQTLPPKRVIILNDGSTDNSKSVISKYADNPLVDIVNKKNTGVIDTKNLGIKMSKTYWTVFLDADDKLSKTFIDDVLEMTQNGAKDIVYTDMQLFGAVNDVFRARAYSAHTLLKTNYINNSALIKTSLLKQIGGYKHEMVHKLEDWELYISLVEAGAKPQYLPSALVKYRQHEGALGRNKSDVAKEEEVIKQIKQLHPSLYKKHGYYRTIIWHVIKMMLYTVRYPGLLLVALRSIPGGIKKALSHIYGQCLTYIQKKLGITNL